MDELKAFYYEWVYTEGSLMFDELSPDDLASLRKSGAFERWRLHCALKDLKRQFRQALEQLIRKIPFYPKN
ncbi:MAG: hypothetical protein EOP50_00155 [Sphingobacteriales bacterium]|nr:MAG: hypothetical protein EOP50_00155 [Sphingobacteriales bacterium]